MEHLAVGLDGEEPWCQCGRLGGVQVGEGCGQCFVRGAGFTISTDEAFLDVGAHLELSPRKLEI